MPYDELVRYVAAHPARRATAVEQRRRATDPAMPDPARGDASPSAIGPTAIGPTAIDSSGISSTAV